MNSTWISKLWPFKKRREYIRNAGRMVIGGTFIGTRIEKEPILSALIPILIFLAAAGVIGLSALAFASH